MNYDSPHVLLPVPSGLFPKSSSIVSLALAGVGRPLAAPHSGPPQAGNVPLVTHPLGVSAGADCPTCNLVEIPYNPNLPALRQ
jgi:hypothetical protein